MIVNRRDNALAGNTIGALEGILNRIEAQVKLSEQATGST